MENIRKIAEEKLLDEEKQLVVLLTSNPDLLESSEFKKFPIIETETDEGTIFEQQVLIVPRGYISTAPFFDEEKKYPSAILKTLIRYPKNLQVT